MESTRRAEEQSRGAEAVKTGEAKETLKAARVAEAGKAEETLKAARVAETGKAEETLKATRRAEMADGADTAEPSEDSLEQEKDFVCIGCPLGCNVTARIKGGEILAITGNTCPRGADYVTKELTDPRRIVTSLVRVRGGVLPVVSVKTAADIPKGKIMDCIRVLKGLELQAPVQIGDVVAQDVCGTGVRVVATGNVGREV